MGSMRVPHVARLSRLAASVAIAVAAAALPAAAQGAENPPKPSSAVWQYVEMIPTGSGSGQTPVGANTGPRAELPRQTETLVREQGGSDAAALTEIATSPALGAPPEKPRRAPAPSSRATDEPDAAGVPAGPLLTAAARELDGSGSDLLGVLAMLLAISAALVAVALLRRRRAA